MDMAAIGSRFNIGIDEFTVVAELGAECNNFDALYAIDRYSVAIGGIKGVDSVDSLARQIRIRNIGNNEGSPKFAELPRDSQAIGAAMRNMELSQKYFNRECNALPIRVFTADHRADTLQRLTRFTKAFTEEVSSSVVRFRLASGNGGVMAATNEAVEGARDKMLVALYLAVAMLCFCTFLSWRAVCCVVFPLILVSQFAEAVMTWLGIGLKVSTLPVVALGAGVGVDYGIYIFARVQSLIRDGVSLKQAYQQALRQTGMAVVFTALTMTVGVATWVFSPLKLQADMGALLGYMFFVNMLGAIVLLPALAFWLVSSERSGRAWLH
jgi:predicted RND superfamily exporter protein